MQAGFPVSMQGKVAQFLEMQEKETVRYYTEKKELSQEHGRRRRSRKSTVKLQ